MSYLTTRLLLLFPIVLVGCVSAGALDDAVGYLERMQDANHKRFYVFKRSASPANHFFYRAWITNGINERIDGLTSFEDDSSTNETFLSGTFDPGKGRWTGWYLMNGVLRGTNALQENWGAIPNAGYNLRGARTLHFQARGAKGGETVTFCTFGVGWNPDQTAKAARFSDSSTQIVYRVTLDKKWRDYSISLGRTDTSYVIGGFGWVADAVDNRTPIKFHVNEVYFDVAHTNDLHFLQSYSVDLTNSINDQTLVSGKVHCTNDYRMLDGVAFTYDNALAAIAFMGTGRPMRARQILDAFAFAQNNDRLYTNGCLRNAYGSGDVVTPPGWEVGPPSNPQNRVAKLPGFYAIDGSNAPWHEDLYNVSLNTGNMAWVMLALLAYHESQHLPPSDSYLAAAARLGDWVLQNCSAPVGFKAGMEGWEKGPNLITYLSTEHNLDLYAAFSRLATCDPNNASKWQSAAKSAKDFVLNKMWDDQDGKFWTGTKPDGITINTTVLPLDVQTWGVMSLIGDSPKFNGALKYAEAAMRAPEESCAFRFSLPAVSPPPCTTTNGAWLEGTAQVVSAYRCLASRLEDNLRKLHFQQRADEIDGWLRSQPRVDGGLYAATTNSLWTGFDLPRLDTEMVARPWCYQRLPHVGATCWYIFAERNINPFWFGHPKPP